MLIVINFGKNPIKGGSPPSLIKRKIILHVWMFDCSILKFWLIIKLLNVDRCKKIEEIIIM
jgi:hypothetical protein